MASVALKCNICPKKPNFSDVSHLLTHVSSKGHLSHYFKLQVRSHQEPAAGQLLHAYDRWYKEHNLAGLLSERMITKEAKKGKIQGKFAVQDLSTRRRCAASADTSVASGPEQDDKVPDCLDPQLSQPFFVKDSSVQKHEAPYVNPLSNTLNQPPGPQIQLWSTDQKRLTFPIRSSVVNHWKIEPESEESEGERSPLALRRRTWAGRASTFANRLPHRPHRPISPDPFVDARFEFEIDEDEESEELRKDAMTKLKGVLWPGMDIFDSATEQMRRKRNQKKDGNILKQMERTSENIEPTELVFSPGGTLRKERRISGMVEDSSPIKGESPIPKRRVTRLRYGPLSQQSPNALNLRGQARRHGKEGNRCPPQSLDEPSRQTLPLPESSPFKRPFGNFGNSYPPSDDEIRLTVVGLDHKPRGGFPIFKDNKEHSQSASRDGLSYGEGVTANKLANLGHDTKPHSGSFTISHSFPQYHQSQSFSNYQLSLSSPCLFGGSAVLPQYPCGQENIEPILTQSGRIDTHPRQSDWDSKHHFAAEFRHASQYLYGAGLHAGFGSFGENDAFGYSYNPLSYSLPHLQHNWDKKNFPNFRLHDGRGSPCHEQVKIDCAASPDGTVSDLDREDIGRLYFDGVAG